MKNTLTPTGTRGKVRGFTLLEVLLALAIIAISFAAFYKGISASILQTQRLKVKTIKHWVALEGIYQVQLGLIPLLPQQPMTEKTIIFEHTWYWKLTHKPSGVADVDMLTITVSEAEKGPFTDPLYGFYYHSPLNIKTN